MELIFEMPRGHLEYMKFNITPIRRYEVILEIP